MSFHPRTSATHTRIHLHRRHAVRLDRIRQCPAAEPGHVRLQGRISYETSGLRNEEVWFEFPEHHLAATDGGDPWIPLLLPAAVVLGEAIRIDREVDARLLEGMHSLQLTWSQWYPQLRPIPIHAPARVGEQAVDRRRAAFFSGGVDSFFTLLRRNADGVPQSERIDDILTVGGFDVAHDRTLEVAALRRRAERVASEVGCSAVFVSTNLRSTQFNRASWAWHSHGCAMAAVALLFGSRWSEVLMPASAGFIDLHPWGTHSLTDGLFSTQSTRFISDGGNQTRVEKIACIAPHPLVAEALRVCWIRQADANCSRCAKCLRTKAVLSLVGAAGIPAFEWNAGDANRLSRILARHPFERRQLLEIRELAVTSGRQDIAAAASRALRRSSLFATFDRITRPFAALPVLWRFSSAGDAWAQRSGLA